MSSTVSNVNTLVADQLNKFFAKADPMPPAEPDATKVAADVLAAAAPAPVATPAGAPPAAPPADARFEALQKDNAELKKALAEMQASLKAAAGIKTEPAPARVTAKSVEGQVEELRNELAAERALRIDAAALSRIERELPTTSEYGTLKDIPDLAKTVLAETKRLQQAAVERGEGSIEISVGQVTKALEDALVGSIKDRLKNEHLAAKVGYSVASKQDSRNSSARALTSDLTSVSASQTSPVTSAQDVLSQQLQKAMKVLAG